MSKEVEEFVGLIKEAKEGLEPEVVATPEMLTSIAQSIYKYRHEQPRGGFGGKGGKPAPKEVKEVKGQVEQAYDKDGRYAFKVEGTWYSTFDKDAVKGIEEGSSVIFGVEKKGQFWNIVTASAQPF